MALTASQRSAIVGNVSAELRKLYDLMLIDVGLSRDALIAAGVAGGSTPGSTQPPSAGGTQGTVAVPAPGATYAAAVNALSPAIYLPMQDENGRTVKDTAGRSYDVVGTWYPNDSAFNPKPPVALGRFAMVEEDAQMTQGAIRMTSAAPVLDPLLKAGTWSWSGWRWIARGSWNQSLWSITGQSGGAMKLLAPGEGEGYADSYGLALETGGGSASGRNATQLTQQWRHLAVTVTGGTATFYVDGTAIGSGPVPAWTQTVTGGFIGSDKTDGGGDNRFLGAATQDAFFPTALSAADVTALRNAGLASIDYLPIYGVDASSYGGNAAWFSRSFEGPLAGDRPLVATWWGSVSTGMNATQLAAEKASAAIFEHANSWSKIADGTAQGFVVIPDYEGYNSDANQTEFAARGWDQAHMYPDPQNAATAPLVVIGDEHDMGDLYDSQSGIWADKLDKMNAYIDKYTVGDQRVYINEGTGATMLQRKRWWERKAFSHRKHAMTSIDFYTGCISALTAQAAKRGGWPTDDHATLRRPISYAHVVERNRSFLSFALPVLVAIGLGHANQPNAAGDWQGVPTPNMVEASAVAGIIGGGQGILWFPQSFKEPTRDGATPQWNAQTAYTFGDQVRADIATEKDDQGRVLETYWFCHRDSPAGTDPRTDTPNVRWVRWRPDGGSYASNFTSHAIGMPAAVQRSFRIYSKQTKAIQAKRSEWNAGAGLKAVVIENVAGRSHLVLMQDMWHEKGTYQVRFPASAKGLTVTVEHMVGSDATATRAVGADGTMSETFTDSDGYFWYSWPVSAANGQPADGKQLLGDVVYIGDSLTEYPGSPGMNGSIGQSFIADEWRKAGATSSYVKGIAGHLILEAASPSQPTTLQVLDTAAATGIQPETVVLRLGTNTRQDESSAWQALDSAGRRSYMPPKTQADVRQVISKVQALWSQARIAWVNCADEWSVGSVTFGNPGKAWGQITDADELSYFTAVNRVIKAEVDKLGAKGHVVDYWNWLGKNHPAGWSYNSVSTAWFDKSDGTHPIAAGVQASYDFLTSDVANATWA